jgi:carboxypeptidase C (cathepsin A)
MHRRAFLAAALLCLLPFGGWAAEVALAIDKLSVERRTVSVEGKPLAYRSTAGAYGVGDTPQARMFFAAYDLEGGDAARRPIAFVFNGGPGAASAYLHIGALGPRRIVLNDDGTIPAPPARLADNELSWLAFTDLVFIDPVGTGFSRGVGKDNERDDSSFWGLREDLDAMARFIRLYLTRSGRWQSPKFLVGESYGGFRAASLLETLPSSYGIALNGAVLISPALQFSVTRPDAFDVLPVALKLPSLVAVAAQHGKSSVTKPPGGLDRAALAEVEAWSLDSYLTGLVRGASLGPAAQDALARRAGELTGLDAATIRQRNGRIPSSDFAKQLLRGSGRIPSLYDGAVTTVDPNPESPGMPRGDLGLDELNAALLPAFNAYVRGELKFETDLPYLLLNSEVNGQWRWRGARGQGFAGAAADIKAGMALNPRLKVLVTHGLFDLVTPYFASVYILDQLHLDGPLRENLSFKAYAAGHMIYTHAAARAALYKDAKAVFESGAR